MTAHEFAFPAALNRDAFLARHWQKAPLLCRGAVEPDRWSIDLDEFIDLAQEDGIDARLVTRGGRRFELEHGPFGATRFEDLTSCPWTLLIQAMEVWEPRYHELLESFAFVPRWRVDDVMVSHAADGGGVGPHVDQYDVFLVQAAGRRRWRWGGPVSPLVRGAPLRLLSRFRPTDEAVLEPGDALYLPPGVPHDGVALGDGCVTVSVGFRAPGLRDLVDRLADVVAARWQDDVEREPRFADAGRTAVVAPSEIGNEDVARARRVLAATIGDDALVARVLGEQATTPRLPPPVPARRIGAGTLCRRLEAGGVLERWAGSRLAWTAVGPGGGLLFADGESHELPRGAARWLSGRDCIDARALGTRIDDERLIDVLTSLVGRGVFGFRR